MRQECACRFARGNALQRCGSEQHKNDGGGIVADRLRGTALHLRAGILAAGIAGHGMTLRLVHRAHDSVATTQVLRGEIGNARQDCQGQGQNSQNGDKPSRHGRLCYLVFRSGRNAGEFGWWASLNFQEQSRGRQPLLSGEKRIPRPKSGLVMTTPSGGAGDVRAETVGF